MSEQKRGQLHLEYNHDIIYHNKFIILIRNYIYIITYKYIRNNGVVSSPALGGHSVGASSGVTPMRSDSAEEGAPDR